MSVDNSMHGQRLKEVTSFKFLEGTLCKDGIYSVDMCVRLAAMARLNWCWQSNDISFVCNFKLCKSLSHHLRPPLRL